MLDLINIHHIAIICSNYDNSKRFYTEILGLKIIKETFREERNSYKLDLALNEHYVLELFSFPDYKLRATRPEALGLRHLAFAVQDLSANLQKLDLLNIQHEGIRVDEITGKRFTFFSRLFKILCKPWEEIFKKSVCVRVVFK